HLASHFQDVVAGCPSGWPPLPPRVAAPASRWSYRSSGRPHRYRTHSLCTTPPTTVPRRYAGTNHRYRDLLFRRVAIPAGLPSRFHKRPRSASRLYASVPTPHSYAQGSVRGYVPGYNGWYPSTCLSAPRLPWRSIQTLPY